MALPAIAARRARRGIVARRSQLAIVIAGAAVMVAALLASGPVLLLFLYQLVRDGGTDDTVIAPIAVVGLVAMGVLVVVAVALVGRTRPTAALLAAGAVFVVVRVGLLIAFTAPLVSDWLAYHDLAIGWTLGAPILANRSMGYPILLGTAYDVAGIDPTVGEVLNLVVAAVGALLLAILVETVASRRAAAIAVVLLAVAPSQAFFTLLLGTETLYANTLVAIALLYLLLLVDIRNGRGSGRTILVAATVGAFLGVSAYVRATSLGLIPVFVAIPFCVGRWRLALGVGVAITLAAAVTLLPITLANKSWIDRWAPSTTMFGAWQLYLGLNVDQGGRFNQADVKRLDTIVPRPSTVHSQYAQGVFDPALLRLAAQRDDAAFQLAIDRLRANALRLPFVLPLKVVYAWGPADSASTWVVPTDGPGDVRLGRTLQTVSQVWWVAVLAGAVLWFVRSWRDAPTVGVVFGAIVVPIALSLLVLEVQPRYHEYVVPLIAGLAAMAPLSGLRSAASWRHGRLPASPHPAGRRGTTTTAEAAHRGPCSEQACRNDGTADPSADRPIGARHPRPCPSSSGVGHPGSRAGAARPCALIAPGPPARGLPRQGTGRPAR